MATAPELLKTNPEVLIRPMRVADVADVVALERASYQFPWSEGIFRDCLRVGYVCRVMTVSRQVMAYGVMSLGAGEAHILNLCVGETFRCRGVGKRLLSSLIERATLAGMGEAFLEVRPSMTEPDRLYLSLASSRSACAAATSRRRPRRCGGAPGARCALRPPPPAGARGAPMMSTLPRSFGRRTFRHLPMPARPRSPSCCCWRRHPDGRHRQGRAPMRPGLDAARAAARHSVTSSVMRFRTATAVVNLLDTPYEDFSEDTTPYRGGLGAHGHHCAKGVEERPSS
jgi:ribosomal-protein-alanine N-acetyltransferase